MILDNNPSFYDGGVTDIPDMSREDASTVLNAARSSCLQRFGKRKQGDDINNSQSMDSCNSKRQWKYDSLSTNDNASDDKICNDSVAAAPNSQSAEPHLGEVDVPEEGNATLEGSQQTYNKEVTDSATQASDNSMIACSCPDIFDFEKFRDANLFAVGQIWALYDELDAMPRFYAQIRHFNASNFEIHLSWLEHNAMNEEEEKWTDNKLPVACGNFFIQKAVDTSQDRFMFSHVVAWTKGKKRNYYRIYPNKGEVWALYKGWSMQWSSEADDRRFYHYEVVEILSTMSHKDGATVIPLVRIKGFVSLFVTAKGKCSYEIPSSELLRFSHGIPFYRTNGNEKTGVPGGFLELDTACLPADLDEAFTSVTLLSYMSLGSNVGGMFDDLSTGTTNSKMDSDDEKIVQRENPLESHVCEPISMDSNNDISSEEITSSQRNACGSNEFGDSSQKNCVSFNLFPYAGSVFHDFDEERSFDRFRHGQIWALYSHVDKFPKLYGWIGKVEGESFSIHLNWLEACPQLDQEKQWLDQDLPISCGMFEVGNLRDKFDTYSKKK
jgi:hypothetical protein